MTIFAIMLPSPQTGVVEAIKREFPADHYPVTDTQWLISSSGTAMDVSAKLGVYDPKNSSAAPTGSAIIFATSSYFGRAPSPIWDWIKAKLESSPSA